ncbi:MAG: AmmeMemoRadiSam system protein B [Methanimicrococcus sp.]|nr:AmmeMemoRadiSam system protein B [Methanimicrococcus sp.]
MREPVVSGLFYEPTESGLKKQLERLFSAAKDKSAESEKTFGVVSPHAGYIFSGKTAAISINALKKAQTYVLLGPNHTGLGKPLSYSANTWKTPLGKIEADKELAKYFKDSRVVRNEDAHIREHSLEVLLPFLQYKMKETPFQIFPIAMGDQSREAAQEIADILIPLMNEKSIAVIASSDFSHYVSEDSAKEEDAVIIKKIEAGDVNEFYNFLSSFNSSVCGYGPIAVLMMISNALNAEPKLLEYRTSNEEREAREAEVVGYASIAFTQF